MRKNLNKNLSLHVAITEKMSILSTTLTSQGYRLKTVIAFDDGSKADVITDLTEVIEWYYKMAEENK